MQENIESIPFLMDMASPLVAMKQQLLRPGVGGTQTEDASAPAACSIGLMRDNSD